MTARRVLLVEDDSTLRESLAEVLEAVGYHVCHAENGYQALELLRAGVKPSLILLDLEMPVMNGWQLRWALLQHPELAAIPVIILSASATQGEAVAGCERVGKPFSLARLLKLVETTNRRVAV